jgi:hypothetical protein
MEVARLNDSKMFIICLNKEQMEELEEEAHQNFSSVEMALESIIEAGFRHTYLIERDKVEDKDDHMKCFKCKHWGNPFRVGGSEKGDCKLHSKVVYANSCCDSFEGRT